MASTNQCPIGRITAIRRKVPPIPSIGQPPARGRFDGAMTAGRLRFSFKGDKPLLPVFDGGVNEQAVPGVSNGRATEKVIDLAFDSARRWTSLGRPPRESETASFIGPRGQREGERGQGKAKTSHPSVGSPSHRLFIDRTSSRWRQQTFLTAVTSRRSPRCFRGRISHRRRGPLAEEFGFRRAATVRPTYRCDEIRLGAQPSAWARGKARAVLQSYVISRTPHVN